MPHKYSSALIRCIDFRLTSAIDKWLEEKGIMDDCDIISVAGVSKAIAEGQKSEDAKFILKQIKISVKLHQIKTLYLMHHTDCGAYGGHSAFENLEVEKQKYDDDMQKTKGIINKKFPDLKIKLFLAEIYDEDNVQIKEI
ncbi:MAG: carbonic anhydrase [Candidatus Magasanikbacteria bacterium]